MSCKTTFLEGARTYRYYLHWPLSFIQRYVHHVPIGTVSLSYDRDPAGPEHHWVARKQVYKFWLICVDFVLWNPKTRFSGHSGQIKMPSLQQGHQGGSQVECRRRRCFLQILNGLFWSPICLLCLIYFNLLNYKFAVHLRCVLLMVPTVLPWAGRLQGGAPPRQGLLLIIISDFHEWS